MFPKSKVLAISLLAAVGVAGFAAGAATKSLAESRKPLDLRERCQYSSQLSEQLGLSAAQHDSVRAIMRSHRAEMQGIIAPVKAQLDSARARVREDVRAVLTPEQRTRYDEMQARERARFDSAAADKSGARTGRR